MDYNNFFLVSFYTRELIANIISEIDDFLKISGAEFVDSPRSVFRVYKIAILNDMGILFSINRCDKIGLRVFMDFSRESDFWPEFFYNKLASIEKDYKEIIEKIKGNRNKMYGHIDLDSFKMGFPHDYCDERIAKHRDAMKKIGRSPESTVISELERMKSENKENERYLYADFRDDSRLFKEIAIKIDRCIVEMEDHVYTESVIERIGTWKVSG